MQAEIIRLKEEIIEFENMDIYPQRKLKVINNINEIIDADITIKSSALNSLDRQTPTPPYGANDKLTPNKKKAMMAKAKTIAIPEGG